MNKMKNFILAVTSFFATVLILSQVALAEDDSWDPKHTQSAPGDEPLLNTKAGRSGSFPQGNAPDGMELNPDICKTCPEAKAHVDSPKNTHTSTREELATSASSSSSKPSKSDGSKGTD